MRFVDVSVPFCALRSTGPATPAGATTCTCVGLTGIVCVSSTSVAPNQTRTFDVKPLPETSTRCPPLNGPCEGSAPITACGFELPESGRFAGGPASSFSTSPPPAPPEPVSVFGWMPSGATAMHAAIASVATTKDPSALPRRPSTGRVYPAARTASSTASCSAPLVATSPVESRRSALA